MNSMHVHHRLFGRSSDAGQRQRVGLGGALAGLGGGVAMLIIGALLTYVLNQEVWLQLRIIARLTLGEAATATSGFAAGPVLAGIGVHLAVAMLLGVLFELLIRRLGRRSSMLSVPEAAGPVYGLVIWALAYFAILPLVSPLMLSISVASLLIQHLVYGAITGLLYAILRPQPYQRLG